MTHQPPNTPPIPQKIDLLPPFLGLEPYDEQEFFVAEVTPLLQKILALCQAREIPLMFFAVPVLTPEKVSGVHRAVVARQDHLPHFFYPSLQVFEEAPKTP